MKRTGFLLSLAAMSAVGAHAQSVHSTAFIGASNTDFADGGTLTFPTLEFQQDTSGNPVTVTHDSSYSGYDRNGDEQTMDFHGEVYADGYWKFLKVSAKGTVTNSFYSPDNDPWFNTQTGEFNGDGVPDIFTVDASAGWTERLIFGGFATNYTARMIYRVHGINTGDNAFSYLRFKIGVADTITHDFGPGSFNEMITSAPFMIVGPEMDWTTDLYASFQPQMQQYGDGVDLEGSSDFANTIEFVGFEVRDENGNIVTDGVTITGASGQVYAVVPEPGTMLALTFGSGLLLRFRRRPRA